MSKSSSLANPKPHDRIFTWLLRCNYSFYGVDATNESERNAQQISAFSLFELLMYDYF